MNSKGRLKFDYTWVIIVLCFLSVMVGLGFCSSDRTYYLTAITEALNIPRGAFSLNDTFRYVTTTIVNLFFGSLIARFGSKKLILAGFAIGAPFGNVCYDIFGSYKIAFAVFTVLMVVVAVGMQYVLTAANRDKKIILENEEKKKEVALAE